MLFIWPHLTLRGWESKTSEIFVPIDCLNGLTINSPIMIVCPIARPPPAEGEDTEYQLKNKEKEG